MVGANSSESNTTGDGAQSPSSAKLCAHDGGETTERCLSRIMHSGKASRRRSEGRGSSAASSAASYVGLRGRRTL